MVSGNSMLATSENAPAQLNKPLREALERFAVEPGPETQGNFFRSALQGVMLVAVNDLPGDEDEGFEVSKEDLRVQVRTTLAPDGTTALIAFTDTDALRAHYPEGAAIVVLEAPEALTWALESGFGGVIINPAGPWAGIPKLELERMLETL
jgi:hypothetical protein